jgi:predicted phage terminase large subunit-like protein
MAKLTEAERLELAREYAKIEEQLKLIECTKNFWTFCQYMDPVFYTNDKPHLKQIADALQEVADGKVKSIAISMPPRAGKSYITSMFCAWLIGKKISAGERPAIMRNSYAATLAENFSRDIRDSIIGSPKYKRIFPAVSVNTKRSAVDAWSVGKASQPTYFCAGVGGAITGMGCRDAAILDDPIKNIEEAMSETVIENIWKWYTSTHLSRLETGCPEIHIATRWSRKDPIGRLSDPYSEFYRPDMKVIKISALDEHGNSFCEAVKTTEEYHEMRRITDDFIWEAEFMQNPIESKGLLYPTEELKRFALKDIEDNKPDGIIGYTDTADKGADYLCSIIGYKYGRDTYITDVIMTQDGVETTEPLVAGMIIDTKCDSMKIEANNGGESFSRNVRRLVQEDASGHYCSVIAEQQTTNKETRMLMASGYVKAHVYFRNDYEPGSYYDVFMRQLTSYVKMGKNAHDDAPDALTGLANHTKTKTYEKPVEREPDYFRDTYGDGDDENAGEPSDSYINMKVSGYR